MFQDVSGGEVKFRHFKVLVNIYSEITNAVLKYQLFSNAFFKRWFKHSLIPQNVLHPYNFIWYVPSSSISLVFREQFWDQNWDAGYFKCRIFKDDSNVWDTSVVCKKSRAYKWDKCRRTPLGVHIKTQNFVFRLKTESRHPFLNNE